MEKIVTALFKNNINNENKELESFYQRVKERASGISTASAQQRLITELYDVLGLPFQNSQKVRYCIYSN